MCKVGADDADGRQPRIEKKEHGHAQGAGTYRAQRHEHAEHRTEDHGDLARVVRSRRVVSAGQGVIADTAAEEDRHARHDQYHPHRHGYDSSWWWGLLWHP